MKILASVCGAFLVGVALGAGTDGPAVDAGLSWDDLARLAGRRADKAKIAVLRSAAKRQAVSRDLAWKDPQLRLGHTWEDSRDRTSLEPISHGDGDVSTLALRFPVPNPFINRQIRLQGDAQVEALEARARAESFAVYCEVKSLCLEEEFARREERFRAREVELMEKLGAFARDRFARGVVQTPLDEVKAEIALERARLKSEDAARARRELRRGIAFLTGIPARDLAIRYTPPEPPVTNAAYGAVLVETAFARRPDLAEALAEYSAAQAGIGAAKAAHLPWFDFVEGSYSHQSSSGENWSGGKDFGELPLRGRKHGHEDDWQIRVALSIPVFTWCGDSVRVSRLVAEVADARIQSLRSQIAHEIDVALEGFRAADVRFVRLSDHGRAFQKRMEARLAEAADAASVSPEDVWKTQLELLDYQRIRDRTEYEWIHGILLLESVSGGTLPTARGDGT